ncbi:MAG: hypothetical protein M0Z46_13935 [Actinomycetota bacterium]|jgi:flagellar biosynthesis chaperone FliJ|nr:hypothetical protein [Actinomycetota bacterium]
MRRYRFGLETVLRVQRAAKQKAVRELMLADARLREDVQVRDAARHRYARFTACAPARGAVEQFRAERAVAGLLAQSASAAERRALKSAERAAVAQARWSQASRRAAALERLDERRRAEHVAAALRAEVALVDDVVSARHALLAMGEAYEGGEPQ